MKKLIFIIAAVLFMSCGPAHTDYKFSIGQIVKSTLQNSPEMVIDRMGVNGRGEKFYQCHYFDLHQEYQIAGFLEEELIGR